MSEETLEIPDFSCRYERYNPETLDPLNDSTNIRLIETGWSRDTFEGKSVLDIGCNSGMLSIFAHQEGAKAVRAIDIQAPFVEFFSKVVKKHDLPISVEQKAFNDLSPESDGADVVLCMEVIHWIVHQGGEISDAIAHLAALTGETLYIETPWDVLEPSIAAKEVIKEDRYNIELFVRALSRHFETVRIERFMTYFGAMPGSKRVLIMATGKRSMSLPLLHIRDANASGISMSRGTNPSELLTTTQGAKVLKALPSNSVFLNLEDDAMTALGDFLASPTETSPLVAPEKIGNSYISHEADGRSYMLFPFVGNLRDYFPHPRTPARVRDPLELAVGTFRHLSQAPSEIVSILRENSPSLRGLKLEDLPAEYAERLKDSGLEPFVARVHEALKGYDRTREDALIHNDFQLGNLVVSHHRRGRVVDLDLLRSGPAYCDIFYCALHGDFDETALSKALGEAAKDAPRQPDFFDCAFAAGTALLWLKTLSSKSEKIDEKFVTRLIKGLKMFEAALTQPS